MKQITIAAPASNEALSAQRLGWPIKELLADGAKAWNLPQRFLIGICSLPFVIALVGVLLALISKDLYRWFTGEDRFAEDMQVLFYSLAFVLSLIVARRLRRAREKGIAVLYVCLGVGLFFLIGEELSWGQRIFGWGTPESLKVINKQGETNFHNIFGVGEAFKWIQLLIGAYGTILPIAVLRSRTLARYRAKLSLLVPHYTLIPYFALLFVWRLYRNLFEPPKRYYFAISEYNEVLELILAIGFFLFTSFQLRRLNEKQPRD